MTEVVKITPGQERSKDVKEGYGGKSIIRNMLIYAIHRTGAAGRPIASSIPCRHGV